MSALKQPLFKECSTCGRRYNSESEYKLSTRSVGVIDTGKYMDHDLELRNCICGSTLATYMEKPKIVHLKGIK